MKLFVFDLDGTLVDTKENIALAANHTMKAIGLPEISVAIIASFVGDGSKRLLERCLDYHGANTPDTYSRAWDILFAYYYENVEKCTQLYPGVVEVLDSLRDHHCAVLTNKPQEMADKLLKYLQIENYFCEVVGGKEPEKLKPNPQTLLYLIEKYTNEKTVMIGDSKVDIKVAKNAGVPSVAFTKGFGKVEELQDADFVVDNFAKLGEILRTKF
ncbi:HAD family hydrolase [Candidatus Uabimicrobium amorphum]|uniref:phosphoglycolate phosphatase n=1 Tax=Uabimicrobium amorphum TaxID=2596890 RepID=A0A5S9INR3_UABAM|nr:HAD-IA family hydrolase [Candidatus Uabimicrobium amorphum]BBM85259.1 haloacid dehalogenase [Candidatus Uabimicrobium amorphum]